MPLPLICPRNRVRLTNIGPRAKLTHSVPFFAFSAFSVVKLRLRSENPAARRGTSGGNPVGVDGFEPDLRRGASWRGARLLVPAVWAKSFGMTPSDSPPKRRGCFFYGCLALLLVAVLGGLGLYFVTRFAMDKASQWVNTFTEPAPALLDRAGLPPADLTALQTRVSAFGDALKQPTNATLLILTAREINALIESDPNFKTLKDKVSVSSTANTSRGTSASRSRTSARSNSRGVTSTAWPPSKWPSRAASFPSHSMTCK